MRFNLHYLVEPFTGFLLNLAYLSKLSKWRKAHSSHIINDYYSNTWDYEKRYLLYEKIFDKENLNEAINYLEFGVAAGYSLRWWTENNKAIDSNFYGFDTFTGLPEDWNVFKAGAMSMEGQFPDIKDNRVKFVKGLFQETLSVFLKSFEDNKKKVVHLDADLYSSTLYVLTFIASNLKPDDIIIFDEFAVPRHEFLAFVNFIDSYKIPYEVIASMNNYFFLAIKIIEKVS